MRSAKRLFRIRTACLPRGTKGATRCRLRFPTTCADPPAQHGLRAQARLSTNDPTHSGSLPTALIHPRRLLVRCTHSAITS
jgi:hypothetical protein